MLRALLLLFIVAASVIDLFKKTSKNNVVNERVRSNNKITEDIERE